MDPRRKRFRPTRSRSTRPPAILTTLCCSTCPLHQWRWARSWPRRMAGRTIPEGWVVNENGEETTDPREVRSVLPMAGAKGSGLSWMIEVLASDLVANPLISVAVMVLDPSAFGEGFSQEVDRLSAAVKSLPPAAKSGGVHLPEERGFADMGRRRRAGIPLVQGTRRLPRC